MNRLSAIFMTSVCSLTLGACGGGKQSSDSGTTGVQTSAGSEDPETTAGPDSDPTAGPTDTVDPSDTDPSTDATESDPSTTDATDTEADTESESESEGDGPLVFSVIGDTPYEDEDTPALLSHIQQHNLSSPSRFLVHVGDIKRGAPPCVASEYTDIRDILYGLDVPAFIIPGDNEWNDCDDPDAAWALWWQHLYQLEQHWNPLPAVERQPERLENFAFVDRGVLIIGINLVGGAVHDADEWALRFEQDVGWIAQQFAAHESEILAAVVFGHALPDLGDHQEFLDGFAAVLGDYLTPTLFLHGDGHFWIHQQGYLDLDHVTRVMVECCSAKPVQVTVDVDHPDVFVIEREPF